MNREKGAELVAAEVWRDSGDWRVGVVLGQEVVTQKSHLWEGPFFQRAAERKN